MRACPTGELAPVLPLPGARGVVYLKSTMCAALRPRLRVARPAPPHLRGRTKPKTFAASRAAGTPASNWPHTANGSIAAGGSNR